MDLIESVNNPKVKEALALRERRSRNETSLFLVEGFREIQQALKANWPLERLFVCPDFFLGSNEHTLLEQASCPLFSCSKKVFSKLSYRDRPDGLLAVAKQTHKTLHDLETLLSPIQNPFLLIAESIEKPGNLGTMFRSADAAGINALILCDPTTDPFNPNVVRASIGTLFSVPFIETSSSSILLFLKDHAIHPICATPEAPLLYTQAPLTASLAIVVGTEQYGLSPLWRKETLMQVFIPMKGEANSLNVATATALLLYEVLRQRGNL